MDRATRALLTTEELELVRATSAAALARLDEDDLVALHDRVRRTRNKYAKLHRRQAAAQVGKDAARGTAASRNQRTAQKAEVFEGVLGDVSDRLATVATARAAELKAERLAAARGGPAATTTRTPTRRRRPWAGGGGGREGGDRARRTPLSQKRNASTRAAGKRTQAKRDSR